MLRLTRLFRRGAFVIIFCQEVAKRIHRMKHEREAETKSTTMIENNSKNKNKSASVSHYHHHHHRMEESVENIEDSFGDLDEFDAIENASNSEHHLQLLQNVPSEPTTTLDAVIAASDVHLPRGTDLGRLPEEFVRNMFEIAAMRLKINCFPLVRLKAHKNEHRGGLTEARSKEWNAWAEGLIEVSQQILLSSWPKDALVALLRDPRCHGRIYFNGEHIIYVGETPRLGIRVLLDGSVQELKPIDRLTKRVTVDNSKVVATVIGPCVLCEDLYALEWRRTSNAFIADCHCRILVIPPEVFYEHLDALSRDTRMRIEQRWFAHRREHMSPLSIAEVRKANIFRDLTDEQAMRVSNAATPLVARSGTNVMIEGDTRPVQILFLQRGRGELRKQLPKYGLTTVLFLRPGNTQGELTTYFNQPCPATVHAVAMCEFWVLSRPSLMRLLASDSNMRDMVKAAANKNRRRTLTLMPTHHLRLLPVFRDAVQLGLLNDHVTRELCRAFKEHVVFSGQMIASTSERVQYVMVHCEGTMMVTVAKGAHHQLNDFGCMCDAVLCSMRWLYPIRAVTNCVFWVLPLTTLKRLLLEEGSAELMRVTEETSKRIASREKLLIRSVSALSPDAPRVLSGLCPEEGVSQLKNPRFSRQKSDKSATIRYSTRFKVIWDSRPRDVNPFFGHEDSVDPAITRASNATSEVHRLRRQTQKLGSFRGSISTQGFDSPVDALLHKHTAHVSGIHNALTVLEDLSALHAQRNTPRVLLHGPGTSRSHNTSTQSSPRDRRLLETPLPSFRSMSGMSTTSQITSQVKVFTTEEYATPPSANMSPKNSCFEGAGSPRGILATVSSFNKKWHHQQQTQSTGSNATLFSPTVAVTGPDDTVPTFELVGANINTSRAMGVDGEEPTTLTTTHPRARTPSGQSTGFTLLNKDDLLISRAGGAATPSAARGIQLPSLIADVPSTPSERARVIPKALRDIAPRVRRHEASSPFHSLGSLRSRSKLTPQNVMRYIEMERHTMKACGLSLPSPVRHLDNEDAPAWIPPTIVDVLEVTTPRESSFTL